MINAVGISAHAAADLTYPALVVEKHLDAILSGSHPSPPLAAMSSIEHFLKNAVEKDRREFDPVASAVSYELADKAFRATSLGSGEALESILISFVALLTELASERRLSVRRKELAREFRTFLASLRARGQGEIYNGLASCI